MSAAQPTPPFAGAVDTPTRAPHQDTRGATFQRLLDHSLVRRLFAPIDISALAYFRIAFGVLMMVELWRFFVSGWIARYYIQPTFHFTYLGFDWVKPWPGLGMYVHFVALYVLAAFIALGLWYRLAAVLFFVGFAYVFLLEQARYLNHFYLIGLISFILIFLPADRAWSVRAFLDPGSAQKAAPAWTLWLLRFQIGVPYFFGGLAKLNPDWLQGEPMRTWLSNRDDWPVLGPLVGNELTVALFSLGGLSLDLLAVPLLLWPRTRPLALVLTFAFHLLNAWLFRIGIFPWFMMAATLLFLPPSWPRAVLNRLRRRPAEAVTGEPPTTVRLSRVQSVVASLLAVFVLGQLVMPFRHHLYPGDVSWTEEGSMFSWQMMLRDKPATVEFFATEPRSGFTVPVDIRRYVTSWQLSEMDRRPDLILQLSHHIAKDLRENGVPDVQIRVRARASLNSRSRQLLIDPDVDLAAQPRRAWPPYEWIMPLHEPLQPRTASF